MHLTRTLSANRERAAEQSRRGEFREVCMLVLAGVRRGDRWSKRTQKLQRRPGDGRQRCLHPRPRCPWQPNSQGTKRLKEAPPTREPTTARSQSCEATWPHLSLDTAAAQHRQRQCSPAKPPEGTRTGVLPVLLCAAHVDCEVSVSRFATLNASSFAAGAQGVRRRAAPPAVQCKLELHGEGETWQEAYTRRYREVLLQRLMGVEAGSVELSEAWSHILASDEQGSAEPSVIELRAKVWSTPLNTCLPVIVVLFICDAHR
eukprot:TRINITY_DN4660_c0_g1_i2.p1 TRINITY_DN4660_c0_g1~~TRINITY_DN4660_c0_g1_i2.p1  ORF type:complete len:260 (-),score=32.54 TRINITY_DN4660_c0_g1_i2:375-1154(-)